MATVAEESHLTLIEQVKEIMPDGADVMFLGDGEFDGIDLQARMNGYGWKYVCRTAKDTILTQIDETLTFNQIQIRPGGRITLPDATITLKQYGPVQAIAWWDAEYEELIYLISNLSISEYPCERIGLNLFPIISCQKVSDKFSLRIKTSGSE